MKGTCPPQRCGDGSTDRLRTSKTRRERGFTRLKATVCILTPLALILLSSQDTLQDGKVTGQKVSTSGTASPGTTGSDGTTTTGTTAASTTGTDPNGTTIAVGELRRIDEIKSASSARLSGTAQLVIDPVRHVLRLKLRFLNLSSTTTDAHGCQTQNTSQLVAVAVQTPGELGIMPLIEGGSLLASPAKGTTLMSFSSSGYVASGPTYDLHDYVVANGPGGNGYWVAYPSLGAAGTLSSGTIKIRTFRRYSSHITVANGASHTPIDTEMVQAYESTLDVQKLLCEAVSLDSRRAYGQPNLEGVLPGDANADLAHIKFNGWIYKGGAFVGNMPQGGGDLSGEGRLQVRYMGALPTTPYIGACLTAFATERKLKGATAQISASTAYVGLYRPSASDPNLAVGDQVSWDTRWNIVPQTAEVTPADYTKNAYHWFELTDAMQAQYANWQMPYGTGTGTSVEMWRQSALALIQPYGPAWQSFSTAQYQATPGAQFPISDSAVRIWRVGQVNP